MKEGLSILPEDCVKVESGISFYLLKNNKKVLNLDNIEIPTGLVYYIFSPKRKYYEREVGENFDVRQLKDFIKQGRVFIKYDAEYVESLLKMLAITSLSYAETYNYIKSLFLIKHYRMLTAVDPTKAENIARLKLYTQKLEKGFKRL